MPNDLKENNFIEKPQASETKPFETTTVSSAPEKMVELHETSKKEIEKEDSFLEETIDSLKNTLKRNKKKPTIIPQVKDAVTEQIEKIMEEDLGDAFRELTPVQKQAFKIKGEETAWEIRKMIKTTHFKVKNIFRLILEWLKMLPGINRFFLEQEAKIKTDKILTLKDKNK